MNIREQAIAEGFTVKRVVYEATILREGWESDNKAWLVELNNGKRIILTTNHGSMVKMNSVELDAYIKEAREFLDDMLALKEMKMNPPARVAVKRDS